MKYLLFLFALGMLNSCSMGHHPITMNTFYEIPLGATREELISQAGKPVAIHRRVDGSEEYEYVERLLAGNRILQIRHYIIVLRDGRVSERRILQESPDPNSFDSYEMQTSGGGTPPP